MASANGPVKSEPSDYDATIAIPDHRDILTKEIEQVIFRGTFGKRPVCIKRINLTNDVYVQDEKWRADDFYKNEDHKSLIEEKVLFYLGYHEVHPDYL